MASQRVFENEETIRQSYRRLECGKQTIAEFQATLAGLGLRETRALRKVLRETAQGATATYSKFIKALTMPDSSCDFLPSPSLNLLSPSLALSRSLWLLRLALSWFLSSHTCTCSVSHSLPHQRTPCLTVWPGIPAKHTTTPGPARGCGSPPPSTAVRTNDSQVSAAPAASHTIPTLEDEYNALTQPRTPSKTVRPEYATDTDVLTWSTPEKSREKAAGKGRIGSADRMAATDVIPTFKPPPSPFKASPSATGVAQVPLSPATAQNELIKSFLGDSIDGAEFRRLLEESGIGSSDRLNKLIECKERGGRARFTDLKQELTFIQTHADYGRTSRAAAAKSVHKYVSSPPLWLSLLLHDLFLSLLVACSLPLCVVLLCVGIFSLTLAIRATMDIFDMEATAPAPSPSRNAPHSKEQCDDLRRQKDVLTWVDSPEKAFVPGKRVGCHDQR